MNNRPEWGRPSRSWTRESERWWQRTRWGRDTSGTYRRPSAAPSWSSWSPSTRRCRAPADISHVPWADARLKTRRGKSSGLSRRRERRRAPWPRGTPSESTTCWASLSAARGTPGDLEARLSREFSVGKTRISEVYDVKVSGWFRKERETSKSEERVHGKISNTS